MCKVIVFAGTTEGRLIAEFLGKRKVPAHICVATEYGEELLPESGCLEISHERLDEKSMELLMREKNLPLVIDATHPYAAEVTENIRNACERTGASYVRVLRENQGNMDVGDCIFADSVEEAVSILEQTEGNLLVTTGSKEAVKYTALSGYQNRVFLRVLSLPQVADECARLGFKGRNLICMQGPFSKELNAAMLRQMDCKYLVTKMSGSTGGFQEKLDAARECGCIPVIIGRPLKETGISVNACKRLLCEKLSLPSAAEIFLVGIGMGGRGSRTEEASKVLREADVIIGAKRMVEACARAGQDVYQEYDSKKIGDYIAGHPEYEKIAVVLSGDVGFYSGARRLLAVLGKQVHIVCGVSSVAYFMSRIGKSWDDAVITSSHGRSSNLVSLAKHHSKVFSILGTADGIASTAEKLLEYGLGNVTMHTGERLSYREEKILHGKPQDFLGYRADTLSVVCIENEGYEELPVTHGIKDREFIRDKVPMTKEEIRTISLSKLGLKKDSVCYDIGAGTGSVAVEMAVRMPEGKVYAIEKKPLAVELLKKNKVKFAVDNLEIVEGEAPLAMERLQTPSHAFIGGSSGKMKEIMELLLKKNPEVRIVVNCIALETVSETLHCLKALPVEDAEIIQAAISRAKTAGAYHMMTGENPITIISCTGKKQQE
ncbi:precorrin-6A reductase [Lachnospiraceae bacterium 46-15]